MVTRSSKMTTDHEQIRRWTEERKGQPAVVGATSKRGGGLLRIDFPGYAGERSLKPISWQEFFKVFDERNLAFVYQDKTASGRISRFGKFVDRSNIEQGKRPAARSGGRQRKAA